VESAQVATGSAGGFARAVVRLGRLTPADVRVELIPIESDVPGAAPPVEHRLFSVLNYGNGCFLFEAPLPQGDWSGAHDWVIHVHPSEAIDEPRVERRVRASFASDARALPHGRRAP
jgi:hypothetical protein